MPVKVMAYTYEVYKWKIHHFRLNGKNIMRLCQPFQKYILIFLLHACKYLAAAAYIAISYAHLDL